jgi:hypothetical protein
MQRFLLAITLALAACRGGEARKEATNEAPSSRAELLAAGGIYPVAVPLGWKLVDANGKPESIPAVAGDPFHRVLAKGALVASPAGSGEDSEAVMFTALHEPAPITRSLLESYAEEVVAAAKAKGFAPRIDEKTMLDTPPRGRLVLARTAPNDGRIERHYLLADAQGVTWQLVYLVRPENLPSWQPLFAAVEGGTR